jgi:protein gp37
VFSLSLGDWLDPEVPIEWLADMLDVIRRCPNLDFLLLTKRPEVWPQRIDEVCKLNPCDGSYYETNETKTYHWICEWRSGTAPQNIWLGISVEDQQGADERREAFRAIPAATKFVSYEPALGLVCWKGWSFVHQIIFGGESGPNRRECFPFWARVTLDYCNANGIAFFCKQDSAARPGQQGRIPDDVWRIKQHPTPRAS